MAGVISSLIADALTGNRSEAMAKIAAEGDPSSCEACGKAVPAGSKMCAECAEKKAKSEAQASGHEMGSDNSPVRDDQEKTSSALTDPTRIEKLANAMEYIAVNPHMVDWAAVEKMAKDQIAPESGVTLPNDGGEKPEKAPTDLGSSVAHTIPTNPMVNPTQPRTDNQEGKGPFPPVTAGVSGDKAGGPQRSTVEKIKEAVAAAMGDSMGNETPENPVQVSSGAAAPGLQRSAEVAKQEQLIASNKAAIEATVRQAREAPKRQTSEQLNEPMLSRKGDKTLDQMLGSARVDEAGAKVASAQELIAKFASGQCTCGGGESCGACRIRNGIEQRRDETLRTLTGNAPNTGQA